MAGRTVIHDARVVIAGTDESTGVMAHAAIFTGYNMINWFVYGETRAMARCAVIHDVSMTERCG